MGLRAAGEVLIDVAPNGNFRQADAVEIDIEVVYQNIKIGREVADITVQIAEKNVFVVNGGVDFQVPYYRVEVVGSYALHKFIVRQVHFNSFFLLQVVHPLLSGDKACQVMKDIPIPIIVIGQMQGITRVSFGGVHGGGSVAHSFCTPAGTAFGVDFNGVGRDSDGIGVAPHGRLPIKANSRDKRVLFLELSPNLRVVLYDCHIW